MNKVSLILSAVVMIAMLVVIAPNIIAMNRGKALRNIAIWLGIFALLGLIYQNFGPGSAHQLFSNPAGMQRTVEPNIQLGAPPPEEKPDIKIEPAAKSKPAAKKPDGAKKDDDDDGDFTPPSE